MVLLSWVKKDDFAISTIVLDKQINIIWMPDDEYDQYGAWMVIINNAAKYKTNRWNLAFDFAQGWADGYVERKIEEDKNEKWMILEPANEFDKSIVKE